MSFSKTWDLSPRNVISKEDNAPVSQFLRWGDVCRGEYVKSLTSVSALLQDAELSALRDVRSLFPFRLSQLATQMATQRPSEYRINSMWQMVLSSPLIWGLVIVYLENAYVLGLVCLAIQRNETSVFAISYWIASDSDNILL